MLNGVFQNSVAAGHLFVNNQLLVMFQNIHPFVTVEYNGRQKVNFAKKVSPGKSNKPNI